jgi:hypothetical protein
VESLNSERLFGNSASGGSFDSSAARLTLALSHWLNGTTQGVASAAREHHERWLAYRNDLGPMRPQPGHQIVTGARQTTHRKPRIRHEGQRVRRQTAAELERFYRVWAACGAANPGFLSAVKRCWRYPAQRVRCP